MSVLAVSLFFVGCAVSTNVKTLEPDDDKAPDDVYTHEKDEALEVADLYFTKFKAQSYDDLLPFYSQIWFDNMNEENTKKFLSDMDERLGIIDTFELISWESTKYKNMKEDGNKSGMFVRLQYSVKREKFDALETLTFFKGDDARGYMVQGHYIDSEGLNE